MNSPDKVFPVTTAPGFVPIRNGAQLKLPFHRRGAKNAEEAQRLWLKALRKLCGSLRLCGKRRFGSLISALFLT